MPPGGVVVLVTDLNTGSAIGGVSIDGFTCAIWFQGAYTLCQAPFRSGTAVYDVTIDATEYAPYVLHVVEDGTPTPGSACCGPCPATTSYNRTAWGNEFKHESVLLEGQAGTPTNGTLGGETTTASNATSIASLPRKRAGRARLSCALSVPLGQCLGNEVESRHVFLLVTQPGSADVRGAGD